MQTKMEAADYFISYGIQSIEYCWIKIRISICISAVIFFKSLKSHILISINNWNSSSRKLSWLFIWNKPEIIFLFSDVHPIVCIITKYLRWNAKLWNKNFDVTFAEQSRFKSCCMLIWNLQNCRRADFTKLGKSLHACGRSSASQICSDILYIQCTVHVLISIANLTDLVLQEFCYNYMYIVTRKKFDWSKFKIFTSWNIQKIENKASFCHVKSKVEMSVMQHSPPITRHQVRCKKASLVHRCTRIEWSWK